MRIIKKMRRQVCVYWAPGAENEQGQTAYAAPIEIACRWEDVREMFLDRAGNEQLSRARVYVDRDLEELGVLWLPPNSVKIAEGAAIAQLTDEDDPFSNEGAYEIRRVEKLPVLRVRPNTPDDFLRTVYL